MLSTLCVGSSGSKSTRLLKHGMAGHMVEIVALSWMAKPCGRSSRNLSVSQPPDLGAWPGEATPVRTTSPARPIAGRNRVILITHLSEPKRQRALDCDRRSSGAWGGCVRRIRALRGGDVPPVVQPAQLGVRRETRLSGRYC